jgi:hypothetical protein
MKSLSPRQILNVDSTVNFTHIIERRIGSEDSNHITPLQYLQIALPAMAIVHNGKSVE